jgi:hypothetical protein
MRAKCATNAKKATEYTSFQKMKADRFKHKRVANDVTDKFKQPLTCNQTNGFLVKDKQQ